MSDAVKVHSPENGGQTINWYRSQSASKSNGPYSYCSSSNFCPSVCVHGCFSLSLSFSFYICSSVYLGHYISFHFGIRARQVNHVDYGQLPTHFWLLNPVFRIFMHFRIYTIYITDIGAEVSEC